MPAFDIIAVLLVLAAVFGYVNFRYIKLPTTIGLMLLGLIFSLLLIAAGKFSPAITETASEFVAGIEFDEALLGIMLSYLLFAGALHVNLDDLANQRKIIAILATVGVIFSTFVTGSGCWLLLKILGINLDYIYCLLFGALISPTDPVAVLGILKKADAPKSLETKITGESLFNDGVGVVVFLSLLAVATDQMQPTLGNISTLFAQEILGGLLLGFCARADWLHYAQTNRQLPGRNTHYPRPGDRGILTGKPPTCLRPPGNGSGRFNYRKPGPLPGNVPQNRENTSIPSGNSLTRYSTPCFFCLLGLRSLSLSSRSTISSSGYWPSRSSLLSG